jgi:transposase
MPQLLPARPPLDEAEHRLVGKLATSRHAPADGVWHAKMITRSWDGACTSTSAAEVGSHPQTVRERLQAFNERGVDGLGIKPGGGRRPRLVEAQRSAIIALARTTPPGKLVPEPGSGELQAHDEEGVAEWTLDALAEAAQSQGIQVARSQVRRIFRHEGVRWRRTRWWATSNDPDFVPKGPASSRSTSRATRSRPPARRSSASTSLAR